jgi:hypothetical protein
MRCDADAEPDRAVNHRAAFVAAATVLFLLTFLFRFLGLKNGFPNDHFLHLAGAQQMLFGEWPTLGFQDPGLPLMYAASALAQALIGKTLFAEAVLVAGAFAAAAVLSVVAVKELTGSWMLGLIAAVFEVAIVPRTYSYPKILVYAAAFMLMQRYVTRPTSRRRLALAIGVIVAFLFRHDHGVYLGIGALLTVLLAPAPDDDTGAVRRAARFVAVLVALIAPYLLFIELAYGVPSYLRTAVAFSARESERQWHVWPSLFGAEHPWLPALLYEFQLLPLATLSVLAAYSQHAQRRTLAARIVPLTVVALLVNYTFIRDPLGTRLPDAVVPAVMLGAWLIACAWRARSAAWITIPAAVAFAALVGASVLAVGNTVDELDRAGLLVSWRRIPEFVNQLTPALLAPVAETQLPSRAAILLEPFLRYLGRCSTPQHRLLVMGFLPEIPVFAHRAFAGGQSTFVSGYYDSEENQRRVLERLRGEIVPFALIPSDYANEVSRWFPLVTAYVRARFVPLARVGTDSVNVEILIDSRLPTEPRDDETGWPCPLPLTGPRMGLNGRAGVDRREISKLVE